MSVANTPERCSRRRAVGTIRDIGLPGKNWVQHLADDLKMFRATEGSTEASTPLLLGDSQLLSGSPIPIPIRPDLAQHDPTRPGLTCPNTTRPDLTRPDLMLQFWEIELHVRTAEAAWRLLPYNICHALEEI